MNDSIYKVYKHTAPNGKVYIGITRTELSKRWQNGKGYKGNAYFYRAIQLYGWDNFKHEILYDGLSKEEAEQKEIELISLYKSNNKLYGYNIENGGNCCGTHSDETKRKISEAQKGEKNHAYGKPSPMRGKQRSTLANEHNRMAHLGQSAWNKGKKLTEEQKKNMRKPRSSEGKANISRGKSKRTVCIDTQEIFPSCKIAGEHYGINRGTISKACLGKTKTAGGYHWQYI